MDDKLARCSKCRERKPLSQFFGDRTRPSGVGSRCKKCDSVRNAGRTEARLDGRRAVVLHAKRGPCGDCGVSYPPHVMDLDHLPGTNKLFSLNRWAYYSIAAILEEVEKCDAVCANCHRQRTYERSVAGDEAGVGAPRGVALGEVCRPE